jgi:feruloyl esterase
MNRLLIAFSLAVALGATRTALAVDAGSQEGCPSLRQQDFSQVQDASAQIANATIVEASHGEPAYCRVRGHVWPQVGFELRLPMRDWNGKFVEIGCGGSCGGTEWILCAHCDEVMPV